jgi:hypothetical protein
MRAAFYECDITPPLGGFMWGYYSPKRIAQEVHDRLYARATVIEDEGNYAAIVMIDTCVVPPEMHDIVTKRVEEYTGIKPECVCICSDHTHLGAPVFDGPEVNAYGDEHYKDVFFRLCADAIILAYNRLDTVNVKFAKSELRGYSYNRNFITEQGKYVTQRNAPGIITELDGVDYEVPILYFEREGKPVGAIVSFALHQDSTGYTDMGYSGDYSCILAKKLKEKYGNDFVTVFLIGTCGDINHVPRDVNIPIKRYKLIGEALANVVVNQYENAVDVGSGVGVLKEFLKVERRKFDSNEQTAKVAKLMEDNVVMRARNLLFYISSIQPEYSMLAVQGIRIGNVFIAALPGEVYTTYGKKIKAESPFKNTIVAENCNSYCGYIPSHKAFEPCSDLYEASLCYHSCHVEEAGDMIVDKALEMANELNKSN